MEKVGRCQCVLEGHLSFLNLRADLAFFSTSQFSTGNRGSESLIVCNLEPGYITWSQLSELVVPKKWAHARLYYSFNLRADLAFFSTSHYSALMEMGNQTWTFHLLLYETRLPGFSWASSSRQLDSPISIHSLNTVVEAGCFEIMNRCPCLLVNVSWVHCARSMVKEKRNQKCYPGKKPIFHCLRSGKTWK